MATVWLVTFADATIVGWEYPASLTYGLQDQCSPSLRHPRQDR
jgi:hypothetical protein